MNRIITSSLCKRKLQQDQEETTKTNRTKIKTKQNKAKLKAKQPLKPLSKNKEMDLQVQEMKLTNNNGLALFVQGLRNRAK